MGRMRGIPDQPEGLRYLPGFLEPGEHDALVARLRGLDYGQVRMHGQVARRTVRHWGVGYDFDTREVRPGEPIPAWLDALRARVGALIGVSSEGVAEVLATFYPPGATIGWHRDAPAFGDVVGVSLGSACRLRFQTGAAERRRVHEQILAPGSGYVLAGPARSRWEHSIPAVPESRWSLTFRTLRAGSGRP